MCIRDRDNVVTVKGPKGELSHFVDPSINVAIEDGHVMLTENENEMLDNIKPVSYTHLTESYFKATLIVP